MMQKKCSSIILLALWWLIMMALTKISLESVPTEYLTTLGKYDKVIHATMYAILTILLFNAVRLSASFPFRISLCITMVIVALYGIADELLQPFFNRTADIFDYLADLIGMVLSIFFLILYRRYIRKNRREND